MLQKEKYGKLTSFQKEAIIEIERSSNVTLQINWKYFDCPKIRF